jgi:hypothetical protein
MFRATFTFSKNRGICGLEIDAVGCGDDQAPSVELTYKVKLAEDAPFDVMHVGRLVGYSAWSEAPLALLLRALHLLRLQGLSSIPASLLENPVRDLTLSVLHLTRDGQAGPGLGALTLKKVGYDDGYTLTQSLPNRSLFPMHIAAESAVPLGAALKAVAQVQVEGVDLHNHPVAVQVPAFTDDNRRRHVLREQIPYFALAAFDAYSTAHTTSLKNVVSPIGSESLVPADDWTNFLAA